MTLLLAGTETEGTGGSNITVTENLGYVFRVEVLHTGKAEKLAVKVNGSPTGTNLRMAIFSDNAEALGTLQGEEGEKGGSVVVGTNEVTLPKSINLTIGGFIWIALVANGGTGGKLKEGTTTKGTKSVTAKTHLSEMSFIASTLIGPVSVWAIGSTGVVLAASLELAGTRGASIVHAEAGTLTPSAAPLVNAIGTKVLTALLEVHGRLFVTPIRSLLATLEPRATLQKAIDHPFAETVVEEIQQFAATLSFIVEGFSQQAAVKLTATIKPVVELRQAVKTVLAPVLKAQGALKPFFTKTMEAILFPSGVLLPFFKGKFIEPLFASVKFVGTLPRATSRKVSAIMQPETARITTAIQHQVSGTIKVGGAVGKALGSLVLTAKLVSSAAVGRAITHVVAAQSKLTGTVGKGILATRTASLQLSGAVGHAITTGALKATLRFQGFIVQGFIQPLTAVLSVVVKLVPFSRLTEKIFAGLVNPSSRSGISSPHEEEGEG